MSKQIVVAAFPCSGKSYLVKHNETGKKIVYIDEDFHKHQVDYLKLVQKNHDADVILLTCHELAFNALDSNDIKYVLVYPEDNDECKEEWYRRSKERKTIALGFRIKLMWHGILNMLKGNKKAVAHYELKSNEYLSDIINKIIEDHSADQENSN